MEVRFGLHNGLNKSQVELLSAVRASQILTFGWPIGVLMESPEYRPRPFGDGIRAEISITGRGRTNYDYWAVGKNGDFYLLQNLFEDTRDRDALFQHAHSASDGSAHVCGQALRRIRCRP